MNLVKNMSRDMCAHSFLIRLCSLDIQEWDHNWHLFRAMLSPPFWVLQQSDFIQDFIFCLSFSMSRKKGGWKNLLAEMHWQKALIFIITSWWVRDSVIAETCLAAHPHTHMFWDLRAGFSAPRAGLGGEVSFTAHCYWTGASAKMPRCQNHRQPVPPSAGWFCPSAVSVDAWLWP